MATSLVTPPPLPPFDPSQLDKQLRSLFDLDEAGVDPSVVLDQSRFLTAYNNVDYAIIASDTNTGAATHQVFQEGINPLDIKLTWSGASDTSPSTNWQVYKFDNTDPNENGTNTTFVSGLVSLYNGGYNINITNVWSRPESTLTGPDAETVLLRCKLMFVPTGIPPTTIGSTTIIDAPDAVKTVDGFIRILGIPPLQFYEYQSGNSTAFASINIEGQLSLNVTPTAMTPVPGRSWFGIRRIAADTLRDDDMPSVQQRMLVNARDWVVKGYVHSEPYQELVYIPPTSDQQASQLIVDAAASLADDFYALDVFKEVDNTPLSPNLVRFHSRQYYTPATVYDATRTFDGTNTAKTLTVGATAVSSTEFTMQAMIKYTSSEIHRDRIVWRHADSENREVMLWRFVSAVPNSAGREYAPPPSSPAPGQTQLVSVSSLNGTDFNTGLPRGLAPGYYEVEHVNGDGKVISSVTTFGPVELPLNASLLE